MSISKVNSSATSSLYSTEGVAELMTVDDWHRIDGAYQVGPVGIHNPPQALTRPTYAKFCINGVMETVTLYPNHTRSK